MADGLNQPSGGSSFTMKVWAWMCCSYECLKVMQDSWHSIPRQAYSQPLVCLILDVATKIIDAW